jgi:cell division protein FtsI (penicillin-binding protein 3)
MTVDRAKWTRLRIIVILAVFLAAWVGIMYRAFTLQVLDREKLAHLADSECHRTVTLNPVRGEILDRNGEKLAVSIETESVFVQPTKVQNPGAAAAAMAQILDVPAGDLKEKFSGDDNFVWVARQVGPAEAAAIRKLDLEGIGFLPESKRFYPNKTLAGHVLGFVGVDGTGLEGLELGMDRWLMGEQEKFRVRRDALGRTFLDKAAGVRAEAKGANLVLTLDRRVQYLTEKALAKGVEESGSVRGMALVVRPRTGEILALSVYPDFNPNQFGQYKPQQRRNTVFTDAFDPGSTFKVFVVAGALEESIVEPLDKIYCEKGEYPVGKHIIHDHDKYEWLTVDQVIKHSSNIGTVKISEKLGPAKMYEYLTRFSFGQRTGVDFPAESPGMLRSFENWHVLDAANVAFGQGVSVTAVQMAMAMSALANDGLQMQPYLVSKVVDSHGKTLAENQPRAVRQVVSPQTAREISSMLRQVVTAGGTGTAAEPKGYPCAGKTGTAQKLDPITKRYSDRSYIGSFIGFAPYHDPELTILVALDEPWPRIYGGQVAAPVFREIVEQALPLLNVSPIAAPAEEDAAPAGSRKKAPKTQKVRPPSEPAVKAAEKTSEQAAVEQAALPVDFGPGMMPNLSGMSMRRVLDLMAEYEMDVSMEGSGQVIWQNPAPGDEVEAGMICQVKFGQW